MVTGTRTAFDPVFTAIDETGHPVYLDFADQVGIILAGEPGAGKSGGLANVVAHGALFSSSMKSGRSAVRPRP